MPKNYRDALAKLNIGTDDPPPRKQRKPKRSQSAAAPPAPKSKPTSKGAPNPKRKKPRVDTNKEVTCCLCGKAVKAVDTREIPIGPACKRHPGV